VDEVLGSLDDTQLWLLLLRVREWNVSAKTATVAQRVLGVILRVVPARRLVGLGKRRKMKALEDADGGAAEVDDDQAKKLARSGNVKEVLDALRVYTDRHYKRLEELIDESYLVDYTLREMDALGTDSAAVNGDGRVDGIASGADVVMVG